MSVNVDNRENIIVLIVEKDVLNVEEKMNVMILKKNEKLNV